MSELKSGFTTGSCATAATAAALKMLLSGEIVNTVSIITPAGKTYQPSVYEQQIIGDKLPADEAVCCVIKYSGDDPDITAGMKIYSKVSLLEEPGIVITGGEGIGLVTRPGLDQPVGEYAINSTPRKMIIETVSDILDSFDAECGVKVQIFAPEGVSLAEKTFNPHMGIVGGISIIGTSGIVEPMSTKALLDTIKLDINMQKSEEKTQCIICPGNYGVTFLKGKYGINEKDIVTCSNYAGDSVRMAYEAGFRRILFCSHIGKLIKVSGGYLNTHSQYGDHRMELMAKAYGEACENKAIAADEKVIQKIMDCVTTTAALDILNEIDFLYPVSEVIVRKAAQELKKAAGDDLNIECILYENNYGELAKIQC